MQKIIVRENKNLILGSHGFLICEENLRVANEVALKIKALIGNKLQKIILFGSRARDDFDKWSDFDIVVIGEFNEDRPTRTINLLNGVGFFGYGVDYVALTEQEFLYNFLFANSVRREGLILYERAN